MERESALGSLYSFFLFFLFSIKGRDTERGGLFFFMNVAHALNY